MSRIILLFLLVSVALCSVTAQQRLLRFEVLQGTNKSFIGDAAQGKHFGYSAGYGVSYFSRKKKSVISFEPQLLVSINKYIFHINDDCDLHIRHTVLSFMPMAGILVTKSITFKTGVFINTSESSRLSLVYSEGSKVEFGNNNWNYYPNRIQAGFLLGMSFGLGQKQQWTFNILLEQFANSIFDEDIEVQGVTFNQPYNSFFSRTCKPTVILLGFSFVLTKFEKEKAYMD